MEEHGGRHLALLVWQREGADTLSARKKRLRGESAAQVRIFKAEKDKPIQAIRRFWRRLINTKGVGIPDRVGAPGNQKPEA
eukprot:7405560-Pyramimonas_sp.AAC.1